MELLAAIILGALCLAHADAIFGIGEPWKLNNLKAKHGIFPSGNNYFSLPKSTNDELIAEYEQIPPAEANLKIPATLWCRPRDPRVCMIMDKAGNNVGIEISFLDEDTAQVEGYDFEASGALTRTNRYETPANTFTVYYTNPEKLTDSGRKTSDEIIDGVYAYIRGELVELPMTDPKEKRSGHFCRQSCIPSMGQHYFYEIAKNETDCPRHVPFFGLYHNKRIVGFGMASYGKKLSTVGDRDWFEYVPLVAAKILLPDRPQCIEEMIAKNGVLSLHVYFVDNPYLISCFLQ